MATENSPTIRLSVWRPAHVGRRIMLAGEMVPPAQEDLLEEAYRWETTEDVRGSFASEQSDAVRVSLFDGFSPELPPAERSMAKLSEALDVLASACRLSGPGAWKDTGTTRTDADVVINLRAHAGLALYQHLRWVHAVFKDVPGAVVTVR